MRPPRRRAETPPRMDLPRYSRLQRANLARFRHGRLPSFSDRRGAGHAARQLESTAMLAGMLLLRSRWREEAWWRGREGGK